MVSHGEMSFTRRLRTAWVVLALLFVSTRGVPELLEDVVHELADALSDAGDAVHVDDCGDDCGEQCPQGLYHTCLCGAPTLGTVAEGPRLAPRVARTTLVVHHAPDLREHAGFGEPPFRPPAV